jgi:hypothetical protein
MKKEARSEDLLRELLRVLLRVMGIMDPEIWTG